MLFRVLKGSYRTPYNNDIVFPCLTSTFYYSGLEFLKYDIFSLRTIFSTLYELSESWDSEVSPIDCFLTSFSESPNKLYICALVVLGLYPLSVFDAVYGNASVQKFVNFILTVTEHLGIDFVETVIGGNHEILYDLGVGICEDDDKVAWDVIMEMGGFQTESMFSTNPFLQNSPTLRYLDTRGSNFSQTCEAVLLYKTSSVKNEDSEEDCNDMVSLAQNFYFSKHIELLSCLLGSLLTVCSEKKGLFNDNDWFGEMFSNLEVEFTKIINIIEEGQDVDLLMRLFRSVIIPLINLSILEFHYLPDEFYVAIFNLLGEW